MKTKLAFEVNGKSFEPGEVIKPGDIEADDLELLKRGGYVVDETPEKEIKKSVKAVESAKE